MEGMNQPGAPPQTPQFPQPAAESKWKSKKIIVPIAMVAVVGVILILLSMTAGPSSFEPVDTGDQQADEPVESHSGLDVICDIDTDSLTITNNLDRALSDQFFNLLDSNGELIDTNTLGAINLQAGQTAMFQSSYDFQAGTVYALKGYALENTDFMC